MRKFFPVLISLAVLASCSSTRQLEKEVTRLISPEAFEQSFTGLMVYDPIERKVLFEQNSQKYFTPASNMKLFTFYAGLKFLNDSIPALEYSIKNDSLIFWATRDPSFLNSNLPDSNVLNFLKSRNENLFYLPPSFSEKVLGPGWSWDDYNSYYSAERSAFPIFGNTVIFRHFSDTKPPQVDPAFFGSKLELVENNSEQIIRDPDSNTFRYSPYFRKRKTEQIDLLNIPKKSLCNC
jgi:D-alanyl-D-alanine carboxypeptidase/D-alanyl-D-alanine-endopeptidase (penicillin-binding protein 4)